MAAFLKKFPSYLILRLNLSYNQSKTSSYKTSRQILHNVSQNVRINPMDSLIIPTKFYRIAFYSFTIFRTSVQYRHIQLADWFLLFFIHCFKNQLNMWMSTISSWRLWFQRPRRSFFGLKNETFPFNYVDILSFTKFVMASRSVRQ